MAKTLYISESMFNDNRFRDGIINDAVSSAMDYENNPLFVENGAYPKMEEGSFILDLKDKMELNAECDALIVDDVNELDYPMELLRGIKKCQEYERPVRKQLEAICLNTVIDLFDVPADSVDVELSLCDEVNIDDSVRLEPVCTMDSEKQDYLADEIDKRRLLDSIIMGVSMNLSSSKKIGKEFPEELSKLYKRIEVLNQYVLFKNEKGIEITDTDKRQMGTVSVIMGDADEKVKIKVQAQIFPVLLCELIHGFMELFISHGLPKSLERAKIIVNSADFLKANPWDMMVGKGLWHKLWSATSNITPKEIPYFFKLLSSYPPKRFNIVMREVFMGTNKGRQIMGAMSERATQLKNYNKFLSKMDKAGKKNNVIVDEYIHADEL